MPTGAKYHKPVDPRDLDLRGLSHQLDGEQVGGERREKHRAGDAGRRDRHPHDVGAHAPHGRVVGFRIIEGRQIFNHRIDRPAAARGAGRSERRQNRIGNHHRVAESQRLSPHRLYQHQRDAPAETGLFVTERKHERAEDQPNRAIGEARKRPAQGGVEWIKTWLRELLRRVEDVLG